MSVDQVVYLEKFVDCTCGWLGQSAVRGRLARFVDDMLFECGCPVAQTLGVSMAPDGRCRRA